MLSTSRILALGLAVCGLARAMTVITYPGWRGNNLISNGTAPWEDPSALGINTNSAGEHTFPYGMQYMYPCGGLPQSPKENRTVWPYNGGAVSIQPGWGTDNQHSYFYVNMGVTEPGEEAPRNYSYPLVEAFEVSGANNSYFGGQFCLPQVPMPTNLSLAVGAEVTLQVIQVNPFGMAQYNCVDLTLVEPADAKEVTPQNCYNSSDINFQLVFTTAALTSAAPTVLTQPSTFLILALTFLTATYSTFS